MSGHRQHGWPSEVRYRANRAQQVLRRTIAIRTRFRRRAGPDVLGLIDLLSPSLREHWGGPLNGQKRRREIVQQLANAIQFDRVLETGTYRGSSTRLFAAIFRVSVETVESNRQFFVYARERLRWNSKITVEYGDSRAFLKRRAAIPGADTETVFVYLDAHWDADLPLAEELRIIASTWRRCIVMIDDFEVPGDGGYDFDDYGSGKALIADYLPASVLQGWSLSYPATPSDRETGARRGCCVLASPSLADAALVPGLRQSRVIGE